MTILIDGKGSGIMAGVADNGRLQTNSVAMPIGDFKSVEGKVFNINSGYITLTDATESAILWIKNNETSPVTVLRIGYIAGLSTGGTGPLKMFTYGGDNAGTIVTTETDVLATQNINLGSAAVLDVTNYAGAQGATRSGGNLVATTFIAQGGDTGFNIPVVLPKGGSLTVTMQPPASNTSLEVASTIVLYQGNGDF